MRNCAFLCAGTILALLGGGGSAAFGQTFESIGVRAQGMGGAFVAVADDATATWWNPAGLATGAYLSAILEHGRTTQPKSPPREGPADRTTSSGFSVVFPALGLSYYRLRISEIAGPGSTAADPAVRQDPGADGIGVRSAAVSQFGVTVGQSVGEHLVLASTLKLVRAGAVTGSSGASAPLDTADDLDLSRHVRADFDTGVMATIGRLRFGLTVRNVTKPSFGDDGAVLTLDRQARVGLAVLSVPHGALEGITVAADADLTTTATVVGNVRHVAAGLEAWLGNGRLGLRAGGSANTVDTARPAGSVGASVGLTRAIHIDASRTVGRDDSVSGWSTSVSVAF
jgi:hypothetical protein